MATLMYPLELISSHTRETFAFKIEIFLVWYLVLRLHIGAGACKVVSGMKW